MRASGISSEALEYPKMRPDRPITHWETGGLSTVMKFDGSMEPKKRASQLFDPAHAAPA